MKIVIAGSRDFSDKEFAYKAIKHSLTPECMTEIVCGCAKGADTIGLIYGHDYSIPVTLWPADWKTYGKAAGPIRNKKMADYADGLIVFINNESKGSINMLSHMIDLSKPYVAWHFRDGIFHGIVTDNYGRPEWYSPSPGSSGPSYLAAENAELRFLQSSD